MNGVIATIPRNQFFDPLGKPLAGGKLYTYLAGSTTLATTYQDQALTIKNENPIPLDATGSCSIWMDPAKSYKLVLKNKQGVTQPGWPVDGISGAATPVSLEPTFSLYPKLSALAASDGAGLMGFTQNGAGATKRTVLDKLRENTPSIFDFMTAAQVAAVRTGATWFDSTSVIQAALDVLPAVNFPPGTYRVSKELRVKKPNFRLVCAGKEQVTFIATAKMANVIGVYGNDDNPDSLIENITLSGFTVDGAGLAENGLLVASCLSPNLYNDIDVIGCKSWGINHNRGFTNRARAVRCFNNTGSGFRAGKEVNQCDFDIEADNNGGVGILVLGADGLRITGGVENNGEDGLRVNSSQIPNIHGLNIDLRYVENNGTKNKALYKGIRLETAGPTNIMQGVKIGPCFLNISGEVGIHIGPNIIGVSIEEVTHLNTGNQMPLVLSSHYTDPNVVKAANINVSKSSSITPVHFTVETAAPGQVTAAAEFIFESLNIVPGGEFQPTILTGGDAGRAYGIQKGAVTKVGDRCFFDLTVSMSAKGTSSGPLDIGGLPYASMDDLRNPMTIVADGLIYSGQLVALMPPEPAAFIRLYSQTGGSPLVALTESALPQTGVTIWISGSYPIR